MVYVPAFQVTARLLSLVEEIAAVRQRIQSASVDLAWIPALQKDARTRNAHATTAIEGNPLTLPEVRALSDGPAPPNAVAQAKREVYNYFAGLRYIERHASDRPVLGSHILELHGILGRGVMDQGFEGEYRSVPVTVGPYRPPAPEAVPELVSELLEWWNGPALDVSPVVSSAVVHYRLEAIHPFADVNGRCGRALALWELFRRGFDTHRIFSIDEYFWEDRPAYYAALAQVQGAGEDLSAWLEYSAAGILSTLHRVWQRIRTVRPEGSEPLVLRPRQERLLELLRDAGSLSPSEIWAALGVSRQGAMDLLNPLIEAGLVEKAGTKKTGRYRLRRP